MTPANQAVRTSRLRFAAGAFAALLALSGCADLKTALGLEKSPPDESKVTQTPPLSIPPDFTLRPPRPGEGPPSYAGTAPAQPQQAPAQPAAGQPAAQAYAAQPGQPQNVPGAAYPQTYNSPAYGAYGAAPAYPPRAAYPPQQAYAPPPAAAPPVNPAPGATAYGGTDAYFQSAVNQYNAAQRAPYAAPQANAGQATPGYGAPAYPSYPVYPGYGQQPASRQAYAAPAYPPPPNYQAPAYTAPGYRPPVSGQTNAPGYGSAIPAAPANPPASQTGIPQAPPGMGTPPPAPTAQSEQPSNVEECDRGVTVDAWGNYTCQ